MMDHDDSLSPKFLGSKHIGALGSEDVVHASETESGSNETGSLSKEVGANPKAIVNA